MTLDDLAVSLFERHMRGVAGAQPPFRNYRDVAAAVVVALDDRFDVCGVHGEARGDLCEAWGGLTAEARVLAGEG